MKKLTLSIGLVAAILSAKAQDTVCVYFHEETVYEFNYQTDEIINETIQTGNFIEITVDSNEVLCLHLSDRKYRVRKVYTYYPSGEWSQEVLDSKDNAYYTVEGPLVVEVGKPKIAIKL